MVDPRMVQAVQFLYADPPESYVSGAVLEVRRPWWSRWLLGPVRVVLVGEAEAQRLYPFLWFLDRHRGPGHLTDGAILPYQRNHRRAE